MTTAIAVMAKAPRAGFSKTRLVPMLTPAQAALMSAAFLSDVTANLTLAAARAAIVPYVAFAPAGAEHEFRDIVPRGMKLLLADGGIDAPAGVDGFGRCLLHAVRAMLALGHPAACVLNADSPNLPVRLLTAAHAALCESGDRVVLGPAEDGGYYLLGVKQAHAALFSRIDWSSEKVAAQTRERAACVGLPVVELETWYDVDDPAALERLLGELKLERLLGELPQAGPQGMTASHTAACARSCGLLPMQKETIAMPTGATGCP